MPHSEIPGSKPARGSPGLNAACHVLHRLSTPRHPPDALLTLAPPQRQRHHGPRPRHRRRRGERGRRPGTIKPSRAVGPRGTRSHAYPCGTPADPPPGKKGRGPESASQPGPWEEFPRAGSHIATIRFRRTLKSPPPRRHGTVPPGAPGGAGTEGPDLFPRPRGGQERAGRPPPAREGRRRSCWWARADLNGRPHAYQACALTS